MPNSTYDGPACDWIYFATPACADASVTKDFVQRGKMIACHIYNRSGIRVANMSNLKPGDTILLAHGGHGRDYHALLRCEICRAPAPVQDERHLFDAFAYVEDQFDRQLEANRYQRDPILQRYTGICVTDITDLTHIAGMIPRPKGNNTIRRWEEVFPPAGISGE